MALDSLWFQPRWLGPGRQPAKEKDVAILHLNRGKVGPSSLTY